MSASPVSILPHPLGRVVSQRSIDANRRNASRSTGPRTAQGKARVARNAIKHGFFAGPARWTPHQQRQFDETLDGLRADLQPQSPVEESCVATMAMAFIRMAMLLRFEAIAAFKCHQRREREFEQKIATSEHQVAAQLIRERERLQRAGLWGPTIPDDREVRAILRYEGRLNRLIASADRMLREGRKSRDALTKVQKQTHCEIRQYRPSAALDRPSSEQSARIVTPSASASENAKTNPNTPALTGNRHQRRSMEALQRRA